MFPRLARSLVVFIVVAFGSPLKSDEPAKEDPKKAIEEANRAFSAAYAKGDPKATAAMYTEKAKLLPPNAKVVEGRDAIEQFWKSAMDAGIKEVELTTVEAEAFGDTIVEQGTAILYGKDKVVADRGKYFVVWKKDVGKWKLHRDFWNSSEPAAKK